MILLVIRSLVSSIERFRSALIRRMGGPPEDNDSEYSSESIAIERSNGPTDGMTVSGVQTPVFDEADRRDWRDLFTFDVFGNLDQIGIGITKVDGHDRTVGASALDRTSLEGNTGALKMGEDIAHRSRRDKAKVSGARRRMLCVW